MITEKRKLFNAVNFPVSGNEVTLLIKNTAARASALAEVIAFAFYTGHFL